MKTHVSSVSWSRQRLDLRKHPPMQVRAITVTNFDCGMLTDS